MPLIEPIRNATSLYRDPYGFLDRRITLGEYDFEIDLPGSSNAMFVGSPGIINAVLRDKSFVGGQGLQFVQPFTGPNALIAISGAEHRNRRRPVQDMFFRSDGRWMSELTEKYFAQLAENLDVQQTFPLVNFYEMVTLHTIIDYVLGVDEDEHEAIFELVRKWMQSFSSAVWLFLKPLQHDFGPYSPWGRFLRARNAIWNWTDNIVRSASTDPRSVLARLITDRDSGDLEISHEDLVWQCIELLLFGHDTTACGSAWVAMHILDNELVGEQKLESADFRQACIKESLRLTPIVVHVTREATKNITIGGLAIRKGQKVFPSAYLAHHHHDSFEHPEVFDPDRFMAGSLPPRNAYFPFGLGVRICVGMPFALTQMDVLLRKTLEVGRLARSSREKTRAERKFVLIAPRNGGLVHYESLA